MNVNIDIKQLWYFSASIFLLAFFIIVAYLNYEIPLGIIANHPSVKSKSIDYGLAAIIFSSISSFLYAVFFLIFTESINLTSIFNGKLARKEYLYISSSVLLFLYVSGNCVVYLGVNYIDSEFLKLGTLNNVIQEPSFDYIYYLVTYFVAMVAPFLFVSISFAFNNFIMIFKKYHTTKKLNKKYISSIIIGVLFFKLFIILFYISYHYIIPVFMSGLVIQSKADIASMLYIVIWVSIGIVAIRLFMSRLEDGYVLFSISVVAYVMFFVIGNMMLHVSNDILNDREYTFRSLNNLADSINGNELFMDYMILHTTASVVFLGLLLPGLITTGFYKICFGENESKKINGAGNN